MERWRTLLLTLAGVACLISAIRITGYLTRPSDIWWTPKAMSPSLTEVADRVELYVRGERLDEHIRSGRLQLLGGATATTVVASDIRFRFNNWDRVRAQEIPALLTSAALLGAACVALLFGIFAGVAARKVRRTSA